MGTDIQDSRLRFVVVDPHPVTRLGVKMLLQHADRIQSFVESASADDVLPSDAGPPHVILVDPDGRAEPIEALRQKWPTAVVVAFSARADLLSVHRAFRAGAIAYVLKHSAHPALVQAVDSALDNRRYADPALGPLQAVPPTESSDTPQPRPSCLSEREDQVLRLIALGLTNREIAERLELSVKTVETYRARTLDKLGLRSRADLVDYAIREGMLGYPQALAG